MSEKPQIWFYQTMKGELLSSISSLVEKIYEKGMSVFIHGHDEALIDSLDEHLWTYNPTTFLPHARLDGETDNDHSILLGTKYGSQPTFSIYLSISAQSWPDENGFLRMMFLFDEADLAHKDWARVQWKQFQKTDYSLQFWKQSESGKWIKQ
jgi:DNA polymerase-3 subunit chi